jgi:Tfp pilus assembly protein PilN
MRAVNLLPSDVDQGRKGPPVAIVAGCAGAVLAMAVLAGGYLQASSKVGDANGQLSALDVQLAAIPQPAAEPSTLSALPQERQARVSALAVVLSQRVAWDRILREISLVLPDDVWLNALQATAPSSSSTPAPATTPGAATTASTGFKLTGFTYSQAAVARLLSRLSVIPDLSDVQLLSATQQDLQDRKVVQFTIAGNVKQPGVPSS